MTRPAGVPRQPVSVQELIRRVRAEEAARSSLERVEERVRAAEDRERTRRGADVRWLALGAGAVTVLTAFALASLVLGGEPRTAPAPLSPELPPVTSISVTEVRTATETVTPAAEPPVTFYAPYGHPYAGYHPQQP